MNTSHSAFEHDLKTPPKNNKSRMICNFLIYWRGWRDSLFCLPQGERDQHHPRFSSRSSRLPHHFISQRRNKLVPTKAVYSRSESIWEIWLYINTVKYVFRINCVLTMWVLKPALFSLYSIFPVVVPELYQPSCLWIYNHSPFYTRVFYILDLSYRYWLGLIFIFTKTYMFYYL